MKNSLFDISGKIDKPYVDAIIEIKNAADSLKIPFFIIGASARDFILKYFYNIAVTRATMDIDFGIQINDWEKFYELKNTLLGASKFNKTNIFHRIKYGNVLIDLIPFGKIANEDFKLNWPKDDNVMSVLGFNETFKSSIVIRLCNDPIVEIKTISLPGLAILKLISWSDDPPNRKKHAQDLFLILQKYEQAGNYDRLYNDEIKLLEKEDFDFILASIKLLGKDMAEISDLNTLNTIKAIVSAEIKEASNYNLIKDIIRDDIDFNQVLLYLKKLLEGIL